MIKRFRTILCLFIFSIGLSQIAIAQEVSISDPNLAAAIRRTFSLEQDAPITQQLMQELTVLNAQRARISDLTGLEHAKNLRDLVLNSNQISDITTIAKLEELRVLSLRSNQITDISALAGLKHLETLFLGSNGISDISALTALTQIEQLSLLSNEISDISALEGLTALETLSLSSNHISDLTPLAALTNLSVLYLNDNQISDITPLSGLTELSELWLGSNEISNLVSLRGLTHLTDLYLEFNEIRIVTPLNALNQLEVLDLSSNQISSIIQLQDLSNLEALYISDNPIASIFQIHQLIAAGIEVDIETSMPHESQVSLTQVLFNEVHNAANDRNDWIELKNISNTDIFLKEWEIGMITRRGASVSQEKVVVSFPDYILPAGEILVITNVDPSLTTLLRGQNIRTPTIRSGAHHDYLATGRLQLPDIPYLLILRSALDKNGTQEAIEDAAGTYMFNSLTPDQPLTEGTAWQRDVIWRVGYDELAWRESGYKGGTGYQPTAPKETSLGTPGYPNHLLVTEKYNGHISISEVMFTNKAGNRNVPQWIELYNNSQTDTVHLKDWKLVIETRQRERNRYVDLELKELDILPNQTVLLVLGSGVKSNNLPAGRIYDLFANHLLDFFVAFGSSNLFIEDGFFFQISTSDGTVVDNVGNLDGDSETQDAPAWELPSGTTKNNARSSILRRYRQNTRLPLDGTDPSNWRSAMTTKLGKSTYYGAATDVGNPGYTLGGILPVALSHFQAEQMSNGVLIKWTTESEVDNAGFYIYRSETKDGEFNVVNLQLIQGAGTTGERNEYTWTDTSAKPNIVYYYRLEDVSHAGEREQLATVRLRGFVSAGGKLLQVWGSLKRQ